MKLLRYGLEGKEKPGILAADGKIHDLSSVISDISPAMLAAEKLAELKQIDHAKLPIVPGNPRIGAPIANIPKLVCIGLNYTDHAQETGRPAPKEPILFMKAITAICGPDDDIIIPKASQKTDWEVELGIVIGTKAQYVSESDAIKYIAGYCLANDVSEREFQTERGGQWSKGKSADTFAPLGPWLVTKDEMPDPQALDLFCEVNGERVQNGKTANMIFPVKQLVSYISQFMTLMPGDVILTGTPAGVGMGFKPPRFLKPGDEVRLGITGLGEQKHQVKAYGSAV